MLQTHVVKKCVFFWHVKNFILFIPILLFGGNIISSILGSPLSFQGLLCEFSIPSLALQSRLVPKKYMNLKTSRAMGIWSWRVNPGVCWDFCILIRHWISPIHCGVYFALITRPQIYLGLALSVSWQLSTPQWAQRYYKALSTILFFAHTGFWGILHLLLPDLS